MDYSKTFQIIDKYNLNFFPVWKKEKTPMLSKWSKYQTVKVPKEEFIHKYFSNGKYNNIAILGGAISNNLYMVDVDQNEFANELEKLIPKTLTVQTRNGKHFYYFSGNTLSSTKFKAYNSSGEKELFTIDIQGDKKYCVAPPSIHETGIQYTFSNFTDIKQVEFDEIIKKIYFLGKQYNYLIKKRKEKKKKKYNKKKEEFKDSNWNELESALPSLSSMVGFNGMGLQPIHGSKRGAKGQNLSVDSNNDQWYCFHCEIGGHKLQWFAIEYFNFNDCSDIDKLTKEQWKKVADEIRFQYNVPNNFKSESKKENYIEWKLKKISRHKF